MKFGRESVRFSEGPAKKTGDHLSFYGPGTVGRLSCRGGRLRKEGWSLHRWLLWLCGSAKECLEASGNAGCGWCSASSQQSAEIELATTTLLSLSRCCFWGRCRRSLLSLRGGQKRLQLRQVWACWGGGSGRRRRWGHALWPHLSGGRHRWDWSGQVDDLRERADRALQDRLDLVEDVQSSLEVLNGWHHLGEALHLAEDVDERLRVVETGQNLFG